jgi:succinate-semialdehyde dehydrogenase/glutarate-semialdehyde dehydrogenase
VHESIYDEYLETFVRRAAETVVGNGVNAGVEMGPLANERRIGALAALVENARDCGADVKTGGSRLGNKGYFFEPTVLANVPDTAHVMQEEPFGPLAVVNPVASLDEAIEKANSVPYGLAAYAFTNRSDYVERMVDGIEAGNVSINTLEASLPETPFGGVKSSGYGREGGTEGILNYMIVKNISHSFSIV